MRVTWQAVCDLYGSQESQFKAIIEQLMQNDISNEEKMLCLIQIRNSLITKLTESGKLTADTVEITKKNSRNILIKIAMIYANMNKFCWTLACTFLALFDYISRYEYECEGR